jgi:hypothetical protein
MDATSQEADVAQLVERRLDLVMRFCDLPGLGSALALQDTLAKEIRIAEAASRSAPSEALARHKHLIRVIGDSLAFSLLHEHTIRTLGRHPGPPANIMGQGDDFSFVMDVAGMLANSGYISLLCDLTNLLRVGDIIAVAADHVLVLECKRSRLPRRLPAAGRLARQRARGTRGAEYLHRSRVMEPGKIQRQALPFSLPGPHWQVLTDLSKRFSSDRGGSDLVLLGDGDAVALGTEIAGLETLLAGFATGHAGKTLVVAFHSDIVREPRWNCLSPLLYPVEPWLRHALLEGSAAMLRIVDIDRFTVSRHTPFGRLVEMCAKSTQDGTRLSVLVEGEQHEFGPGVLDPLFYTPTSLAEMREALLSSIDALLTLDVADESTLSRPEATDIRDETSGVAALDQPAIRLAKGDDVTYGTVYLMPDGNDPVVVYEAPSDGENLLHFAWDPKRNEVVCGFINGIMTNV